MASRFDLGAQPYAHRGLWRPEGPVENSLTAFLAAAEAGYGIELDVRPSKDGVPIVFHDPTLDRLTEQTGLVNNLTALELANISLSGTSDQIPTLADLLAHLPETCPILCELKIDGETSARAFAQTVGECLVAYSGPAAAMSFSEAAFAALPSDLMRGQLIPPSSMIGDTALANMVERSHLSGADYLACHVGDVDHVHRLKSESTPLTVWTVKDRTTHDQVITLVDAVIFEQYDPN
ncbi:MAG: glycerophosphodiester phosphodiesterase family protein [Pseudomonadota bacterium]